LLQRQSIFKTCNHAQRRGPPRGRAIVALLEKMNMVSESNEQIVCGRLIRHAHCVGESNFHEGVGNVTSSAIKFYIERQQGKHWTEQEFAALKHREDPRQKTLGDFN